MDSDQNSGPGGLDWEDVLATARKDVRNGRLILSAMALLFVGVIWAVLPAACGAESELGELSQNGAYLVIGLSSLGIVLGVASWLRPIPVFLVARWLAFALAAVNAVAALVALVKGGGLKLATKHAFKFASMVWGADIMGDAHGGAVILAAGPTVEDHFNEVMDEVKSDGDGE